MGDLVVLYGIYVGVHHGMSCVTIIECIIDRYIDQKFIELLVIYKESYNYI